MLTAHWAGKGWKGSKNSSFGTKSTQTDSNEQNAFLTVAVDTLQSNLQDNSCIIEYGEHYFIKVRSFVNYHYARVLNFLHVFNGLQKGVLIRKENVSEELLKRIQDGAKKSNRLNNKLKISIFRFYYFYCNRNILSKNAVVSTGSIHRVFFRVFVYGSWACRNIFHADYFLRLDSKSFKSYSVILAFC